jgi:hypothetical protein
MNTGWAYAEGEIIVQIEDYMTVKPTWLSNHVDFIRNHKNLVAIGDVFDADTGLTHYNRKPAKEMQTEWVKDIPDLKYQFDNPTNYKASTNAQYAAWLSGNTSFHLEHVLKFNGVPEWPCHWPEVSVAPYFFEQGLSMWPLETAPAWHSRHNPGRISDHVMHIEGPYGDCVSEPVIMEGMGDIRKPELGLDKYKRDIVQFRKEHNLWV